VDKFSSTKSLFLEIMYNDPDVRLDMLEVVLPRLERLSVTGDLETIQTCGENTAALTFDDGPCNFTEAVLDALKVKNAKAAFLVVGSKNCEIGNYTSILKRMIDEGHEIGVHTWSHISIPYHPDGNLRDEMGQIENAVWSATGVRPRYFRPPFGDWDDRSVATMGTLGVNTITWDVTTDDVGYLKASISFFGWSNIRMLSSGFRPTR